MKKNLVFKLGLFCAALVLIATCFVSSAWAKYTSSVTLTDSARVARYSFVVDGTDATSSVSHTIELFDTNFTHIITDTADKNQVSGVKVIAPGSTGDFSIAVDWTGTEVSLSVDYSAVVTNAKSIPVEWKVGTGEWSSDLATAINSLDKTWNVNESDPSSNTTVISWRWVYNGNDGQDTLLGHEGAEIQVAITVTATQVDDAGYAKN